MDPAATLGALIATGSRSTVHAWGNDAVAKVPRAATPDEWIRLEATYSAAVRAAGAPVPEFLGFAEHDNRTVSVYRRASGKLMWDAIAAAPDRIVPMARVLAVLQAELAAVVPPVAVPAHSDRLRAKIRRARGRLPSPIGAVVDEIPEERETVLCHGDLHPGNVILTADGPMVIDWFDAARGDRLADLARTSILLSTGDPSRHLPGATETTLAAFHDAYVEAAAGMIDVEPATFERWRAIQAIARIAEGMDEQPLLDVWHAWVVRCGGRR